jgi:ketosteroid isomerase-like protein
VGGAAERRDVERILEFWTDDAIVYPPGLPPILGKAALRSYVQWSLAIPGFRITRTSSDARVSPDGQFAYLLCQNAGHGSRPHWAAGDHARPGGHHLAP